MMNDSSHSPVPATHPPSSQPKKRTRVTPSQLTILEETFALSATPDSKMRKQLAQKLQMPERSIQIWFQNRRAKVKMLQKRALMREEQEAAKARLYAEAAAYAQQPYWLPRRPQSAKVPIQRAWSSDMSIAAGAAAAPMPPPPFAAAPPPPPPPPPHFNPSSAAAAAAAAAALPLYPLAGPLPMSGTIGSVGPTPPPPSLIPGSLDTTNRAGPDVYHTDMSPPSHQHPSHASEGLAVPRIRRTDSEPAPAIHDSSLLSSSGAITASSLTIGTWHRMKITQHDLVCHYDAGDRTFAWHIRDSDYHFKVVVAFDNVTGIEIGSLGDNLSAEMHIDLAEAPLFFMESDETWIQCSDFTEGMQASIILRHSIRGLSGDLRHILFALASIDDHLCQVTCFDDPTASLPGAQHQQHQQHQQAAAFDHHALLAPAWRHQSLPLTTDFGWTTDPESLI